MNDIKGPKPINTIAKWERPKTNIERATGGHSINKLNEIVALPRTLHVVTRLLFSPIDFICIEATFLIGYFVASTIQQAKVFSDNTNKGMMLLLPPLPLPWSPENRFHRLAEGKSLEEIREMENRELVGDGLRIMADKCKRGEVGVAEFLEYVGRIADGFPGVI